jgi:hypothetical protein
MIAPSRGIGREPLTVSAGGKGVLLLHSGSTLVIDIYSTLIVVR